MIDNTSIVETSTSQLDADLAVLAAVADQISDFVGVPLKFEKSHWNVQLAKDKKIEVTGKQFVVDANSYAFGWVKWENRHPVVKLMGRPVDGYVLPVLDRLPDRDENLWPFNSKGEREDPWQQTHQIVLKAAGADESDDLLVWTTTSWGGKRALSAFLKSYAREAKAYPDQMPITRLTSRDEHNPDYGMIPKPVLEIVGWHAFGKGASGPGNKAAILPALPAHSSAPQITVPARKQRLLSGDDMDDDIPF